jgi:hypothetical protein
MANGAISTFLGAKDPGFDLDVHLPNGKRAFRPAKRDERQAAFDPGVQLRYFEQSLDSFRRIQDGHVAILVPN